MGLVVNFPIHHTCHKRMPRYAAVCFCDVIGIRVTNGCQHMLPFVSGMS